MSALRIMHVANFYGPASGGLRTTMHALARGYAARGHQPILVVPGTEVTRSATPYGWRITLPSTRIPGTGGYRMITDLSLVERVLDCWGPDVLEVSDRTSLIGLGGWAQANGVPSVAFAHERVDRLLTQFVPGPFPWQRVADVWNRQLDGGFDAIVATTRFAATELDRIGSRGVRRIPLGVDLARYHPSRRDLQLRSELAAGADVLLVHCGRLSAEKTPQVSVDALRVLLGRGVRARLVVAGAGPRADALRRRARGLPVTFLGHVEPPEVLAQVLACADLALAPGPHETFGLAALECLASGTPVVVSARSALPELIGDAGLPAQGPAGFATAALRLLHRPEHERRAEARAVAERFPWDRTVEEMLRLHRHLRERPDGGGRLAPARPVTSAA